MAQPADQPAFDDQHASFDLRLVARPARPGRQHGGSVMGRHLGIGAIDLRLVQARFDDGDFGVIGHDQLGHPADRGEGARMGGNPVAEPLCPRRFSVGEVRGAKDGHKDLRRTRRAGQPVDDHRDRVAGVIDEQLVAPRMRF